MWRGKPGVLLVLLVMLTTGHERRRCSRDQLHHLAAELSLLQAVAWAPAAVALTDGSEAWHQQAIDCDEKHEPPARTNRSLA
jgi:hypothetical protein